MIKPDDSSLDLDQRRAVEERARKLLDRAEAWNVFPTPIDVILEAAKIKVAPSTAFEPARIMAYLQGKAASAVASLKSAMSKIFGIYDADEALIHIDDTVVHSKQSFLKLHETGHHELPHHRRTFRIFQDCNKTLSPEISDLFEREANNFARFAIFQGDTFGRLAADCKMSIRTPINLATKFKASNYASAREFARTNHRECLVIVCNPLEIMEGYGVVAPIRRIEPSPSFRAKFPVPDDSFISPGHALGATLPMGRRMLKPTPIGMHDKNGDLHECVAEALDTRHNIIILIYPVKALTASTIILPAGFNPKGNGMTGKVA